MEFAAQADEVTPLPSKSKPIDLLLSPFVSFAKREAAGGILLLMATVAALVWANSPWGSVYHNLWETKLTLTFGDISLSESRHHWINDGLMAIFFFLVGLEIKREVLTGELSSIRKAAFPFIAALGGTIVPALIYFSLNRGTDAVRGWGIPMATDIAFALGVLALLGDRVPPALKVFVAALAIVDDIFAVLVIAVFYTHEIAWASLALAGLGILLSMLINWAGVRTPFLYAALGVVVWLAVLRSGVHATIAGVLLAFTIPVQHDLNKEEFVERGRWVLDEFDATPEHSALAHNAIYTLEDLAEKVQSPLHRIEHQLQPWVSFLIMPVFALANAGVHLPTDFSAAANPVALGAFFGLLIGKPLGITLFAWLAVIAGFAAAPAGVRWLQTFAAAWVCGIGFTMSLFIANLALPNDDLLNMAKIGTMAASLLAGLVGSWLLLRAARGRAAVLPT